MQIVSSPTLKVKFKDLAPGDVFNVAPLGDVSIKGNDSSAFDLRKHTFAAIGNEVDVICYPEAKLCLQ